MSLFETAQTPTDRRRLREAASKCKTLFPGGLGEWIHREFFCIADNGMFGTIGNNPTLRKAVEDIDVMFEEHQRASNPNR